MSFRDAVAKERGDGWAGKHADRLLMRLKELLAAHDRGAVDLRDHAEDLRLDLYGKDGFDHPKCMMICIGSDGRDVGAFRGPLLLNDLLATGEPGPWPDNYRLFITQDGRRTHRWHGKRGEWVTLKK